MAHVAINVALYGADGRRWAMTERAASSLERDATSLQIGPSALRWDGEAMTITIDEVTAPWPSRIRGTVRLLPGPLQEVSYPLDPAHRHHWQPIAPCARVEVDLAQPASRWRGSGYLDSNRGDAPLESDFRRWHWSRARAAGGRTSVFYDVTRRDGSELALALAFAADRADAQVISSPPLSTLRRSAWRIERAARSESGLPPTIATALEDGPFYARSLVHCRLDGEAATAIHESLDLDRFASPWVQAMLPFRMPRRA